VGLLSEDQISAVAGRLAALEATANQYRLVPRHADGNGVVEGYRRTVASGRLTTTTLNLYTPDAVFLKNAPADIEALLADNAELRRKAGL